MSVYWAAEPSEEFSKSLKQRVDDFYNHVAATGRLHLWRRSYDFWNQGGVDLGKLKTAGDQDQLTMLKVNHFRSIGTHTVNLVTSDRPSFDCKASNTDYASETACQLGQSILDFDMRDKRLDHTIRQTVERAWRYGEGWLFKTWDAQAGEPWAVDPATEQPIFTGALRYESFNPIDVVREPLNPPGRGTRWVAVRRWVNKWDLAARYPEFQEEVLNGPTRNEASTTHWMLAYDRMNDAREQDEVELYEFYHDRTPALPEGRRALLVGGTIIDDGALPYKRLPGYQLVAAVQDDSNFGYSVAFDLLSIQEAVNALFSTIASNQAAFGVQSILIPKGHALSVKELSKGLQQITYDPGLGEPKPLQLVRTAPETFAFLTQLVTQMEQLSAINSVVRGDPQASLKSGSALAMVASQALQFSLDLQAAYIALIEDVGTGALDDYKAFAKAPQIALVVGKSNRARLREWVGQDISAVARVTVDVGSALSKTLAGRAEMANNLVQARMVTDPRQYIQVLTTGRLEHITQGATSELTLIASENEAIQEGKPVKALATDDHVLHIKEHKVLIATPEARQEEQLVGAALDHIAEHVELLRQTDPLLLQVLGIPVPPDNAVAQAGMAPPPGEPMPPGPPGVEGGSRTPEPPNMPQMPSMPGGGPPVGPSPQSPTPPGAQPAQTVP